MLNEVMDYYRLAHEFRHVGYFETEHHQQVFHAVKMAIKRGELVVLSGIVGCGKTTVLQRVQDVLRQEKEILVSKSLAVDKESVNLGTLIMALFYDVATEKEVSIPTQSEKRERRLLDLIRKRQKPIALFIDEAHDLHGKTLVGLKRLMELVRDGGGTLSVVLAGHPKLKNDLCRPALEEIGSRATVFTLDGIKGHQRPYITWLIEQCTHSHETDVLTEAAMDMLAERLATPLQIEQYLTLAFEEAYKIGQKPVTEEVIESVLSKDINGLEPKLTRHGYHTKALAELLNVRPAEIRSLFHGRLSPNRAQELRDEMLAAGIPL